MSEFFWNRKKASPELNSMLEIFCAEFPEKISAEEGKRELVFKKAASGVLKVTNGKDKVIIEGGSLSACARGIGSAMAGYSAKESTPFRTLGIMIDCSRNKVFTVDFMKHYFVRLALMGYNMAMFYTEDTYQMPGEPFFGYMRGAYSMQELKDLDAFAGKLGIELIACIQTLGHLGQILRWNTYRDLRDTSQVLLVDAPETYKLIEKMVKFWKEALSSRRIHIGMDEAHDLGRGRFMDRHGYENAFDLFNRHLGKVNEICKKNGLTPIIWSDMYFRLGNKNMDYYDPKTKIPAKVKAKIPKNVQLCYWDYYHTDADFYEDFIKLHRALGSEPILGSGVWTWSRCWYDHAQTMSTVVPCIEACRKTGLKEIFFTMWGDNGGYCAYRSTYAGLEFAAGLAYGLLPNDNRIFSARLKAICGADYDLYLAVSAFSRPFRTGGQKEIRPEQLLWDDPLLGMVCTSLMNEDPGLLPAYEKMMKEISAKVADSDPVVSPELQVAGALADAVSAKILLRREFLKAYEKKNRTALKKVANERIPAAIAMLDEFDAQFRADWLATSKPFGLEVIQRRNAGVRARLEEARLRIFEFLDGSIDRIEEMDAAIAVRGIPNAPADPYSGCAYL